MSAQPEEMFEDGPTAKELEAFRAKGIALIESVTEGRLREGELATQQAEVKKPFADWSPEVVHAACLTCACSVKQMKAVLTFAAAKAKYDSTRKTLEYMVRALDYNEQQGRPSNKGKWAAFEAWEKAQIAQAQANAMVNVSMPAYVPVVVSQYKNEKEAREAKRVRADTPNM